MLSPATHTESKTRFSRLEKEAAIASVLPAARGVNRLIPVLLGGKIIAWVSGQNGSDGVWWLEHKPWMSRWIDGRGYWCGFPTIDNLISEVTQAGKLRTLFWYKALGFAPSGQSWSHLFGVRGNPYMGSFGGSARVINHHSEGEAGSLLHGGNVSPDTKHLLSATMRTNGAAGADPEIFLLYDMVASYDGCTFSTSSQSMTNGSAPQRYVGSGQPGLCVMGAATGTMSITTFTAMTYTDQDGNTAQSIPEISRVASPSVSNAPSASRVWESTWTIDSGSGTQRSELLLPLQVGDTGVNAIEAYTNLANNAGTFSVILGQPIAWMPVQQGDRTFPLEFVKQIPSLPRILDGACLTFAMFHGTSTQDNYTALLHVGWG